MEIEEPVAAGDRVFVVVHERSTGRVSGATVESRHFAVWTLADGKVVRIQVFDDRGDAERAAGLAS